jgi:hypothetical protein
VALVHVQERVSELRSMRTVTLPRIGFVKISEKTWSFIWPTPLELSRIPDRRGIVGLRMLIHFPRRNSALIHNCSFNGIQGTDILISCCGAIDEVCHLA